MGSSTTFFCPICFEKYNKSCHQPITISCGHTFCLYCLKQITQDKVEFECVICRQKMDIDLAKCSKNILVIELLEHIKELGEETPCRVLDCSVCNPVENNSNSQNDSIDEEEISEQEMIDQMVGDFDIFLQQRPETVAFMLEGDKRQSERKLLASFFDLLDECAEERMKILGSAEEYRNWEIDEEVRQVEIYARQFETLCTYMITTILRLRTLNSFTAYSIQRIRAYFPLRNQMEFVELTHDSKFKMSRNERANANRLEERLQRISRSTAIYRRILNNEYVEDEQRECDFIEYIPSLRLHHCLVCNAVIERMVGDTNIRPLNQHIQEPSHQFLMQEVERLPFEILLRRTNSYRIRLDVRQLGSRENSQSRPTTAQPQTSHSNAENRLPAFFS